MTLSTSLSTAMTGLTMNARLSDVTASNVANALTEGYARRDLLLSASTFGGVTIDGVQRNLNAVLLADLRLASAETAARDTQASFYVSFSAALGDSDESASLSGKVAALSQTLIEAATRPDISARLTAAVDAADSLARTLNSLSDQLITDRETADKSAAYEVSALNSNLKAIAKLNKEISTYRTTGRDYSGLADQRQKLVSDIASLVPLREIAKDNGQIALYTATGIQLLDGKASEIAFTPATVITPDMNIGNGSLAGLTVNGQPITVTPAGGRLGEGRLSALFSLRDSIIPKAQAQLDGFARDLIERFASSSVDPSLAAGAPGLFTDQGGGFIAAAEPGLASRIAVHSALTEDHGNTVFRLRDGIGANTPGLAGDPSRILALSNALSAPRLPASTALATRQGSAAELAAILTSTASQARLNTQKQQSFAAARNDSLKTELLKDGVDTDQEMQTLLILEKAYAANAKVIQTVDTLLATLLEI